MLNIARIVVSDFFGLLRVCGPWVALRWLGMILLNFKQCAKMRMLQPADLAMGEGPFRAHFQRTTARLVGHNAIGCTREIWVRRSYVDNTFLSIKDGDTVVDLGTNIGSFSLFALGHGPRVRVVSVEADPTECECFRKALAVNGWQDRAQLFNVFIGGTTDFQADLHHRFRAVPTISADELLSRAGIDRIDLLKVDIEGSEFDLLKPGSSLLRAARQVAMEVHYSGGEPRSMVRLLENEGFDVRISREDAACLILQARRRSEPRHSISGERAASLDLASPAGSRIT